MPLADEIVSPDRANDGQYQPYSWCRSPTAYFLNSEKVGKAPLGGTPLTPPLSQSAQTKTGEATELHFVALRRILLHLLRLTPS